ncbi:MAG: HlyD family secretion protein [Rickettsiaceae bacterium]|nr:HlyD family secretion protein [Rickettsiaceae bacterium]
MEAEENKVDLNVTELQSKSFFSKILKSKKILVAIALVFLLLGYTIGNFLNHESTDNAYVEADITTISPEISGLIKTIHILEHDPVKKGALIAEIDETNYQIALDKSIALLEQAKQGIAITEQKISQAKLAILDSEQALQLARVNLKIANNELLRTENLTSNQFSSKQILENAQAVSEHAKYEFSKAEIALQSSHQNLAVLESEREINKSKFDEAKVGQDYAEQQLKDTKLYAPMDGFLANSFLRIGAFARAGYPIVSVVPTKMYIKANFKETQFARIKSGMEVDITFDAFKTNIKGVVRSHSPATGSKFSLIPTDNATGNFTKVVQRIPVIIDFEIPEDLRGKILPGLSVVVSIKIN